MEKEIRHNGAKQQRNTERRALFPGSFDPFTVGHQSLVDRGLEIFDRIVIAAGVSATKPVTDEALAARLEPIRRLYANQPRVEVISYIGLTVDVARTHGCNVILRGIRNVIDMEYERTLADVNRRIAGIETVFLFTLPELASVSSSIVRELEKHGHDAGQFLPVQNADK